MLFQHTWKHVVSGQKTQNRRLVQEGDYAAFDEDNPARPIAKVIRTADAGVPKVLFEVGKIYSVQPGIAKKTVGNIRLIAIRRERLHDLSDADALKESPVTSAGEVADAETASKTFRETWNNMYAMPGDRWEDNPEVWVLEFEPAIKGPSSARPTRFGISRSRSRSK
jgi:hypothetical protein